MVESARTCRNFRLLALAIAAGSPLLRSQSHSCRKVICCSFAELRKSSCSGTVQWLHMRLRSDVSCGAPAGTSAAASAATSAGCFMRSLACSRLCRDSSRDQSPQRGEKCLQVMSTDFSTRLSTASVLAGHAAGAKLAVLVSSSKLENPAADTLVVPKPPRAVSPA